MFDNFTLDTEDLFQYAQSTSFAIRALGQLTGLQVRALSDSQSDTLEEIEKAQRQGRLPWVTTEDQQRVLSVSKYGVKVMDIKRQRVYVRYPLHAIANIIYYEDTYCKHMVAARIIKSEEMVCDISVFECKDEVSCWKDDCTFSVPSFFISSLKPKTYALHLRKHLRLFLTECNYRNVKHATHKASFLRFLCAIYFVVILR